MWYRILKDLPGLGRGMVVGVNRETDLQVLQGKKIIFHLTNDYVLTHSEEFEPIIEEFEPIIYD